MRRVLVALLTFLGPPSAVADHVEDSWIIESARSAMRQGRSAEAIELLEPLAQRDDVLGPLARLGIANAHVIQADVHQASNKQRRDDIRRAIDLYRGLLAAESSLISSDDVRHNLMVAKLMLAKLGSDSAKTAADSVDKDRQESEPSADSSTTPDPSERGDVDPPEASISTPVKQPTPGIADRDPGILSPEQARERLQAARQRATQTARPAPSPQTRRRWDDY